MINLATNFSTHVVRLGVTGLAGSGKTVFITSLVKGLLDEGGLLEEDPNADFSIESVFLQPHPDDTVPRFGYEENLDKMIGTNQGWPDSTRKMSKLRLSLRIRRKGLKALSRPSVIHLDITDFPGEWLMDLALLDKDFMTWSDGVLAEIQQQSESESFLKQLSEFDSSEEFKDAHAKCLAKEYTAYLKAVQKAGYSNCLPGRFILPGELENSNVLTFSPLRLSESAKKGSLGHEFRRRYEQYKSQVVKPFFKNHFAKIDRQIVLVDVLGAITAGPRIFEDQRNGLAGFLNAFQLGRNTRLDSLLGRRRVEKLVIAATKADHVLDSQHDQLLSIVSEMLRDTKDRAKFARAQVDVMSIAALRTTEQIQIKHKGKTRDVLRGKQKKTGKIIKEFPGTLPSNPGKILSSARNGDVDWPDLEFLASEFVPSSFSQKSRGTLRHIRLDKAIKALIGDLL